MHPKHHPRKILSEKVLDQLGDTPLNDPSFDGTGVRPSGTLRCVRGSPEADTTRLVTQISAQSRGPALDLLNELAADGFSCYTLAGGTRCEKTWKNGTYPVTDGRTVFWRAGILIDTEYSNLTPSSYTDSIIAALFD